MTFPPRTAARISAVHKMLSELPRIADSIWSMSSEWLRVRLFRLITFPRSMLRTSMMLSRRIAELDQAKLTFVQLEHAETRWNRRRYSAVSSDAAVAVLAGR